MLPPLLLELLLPFETVPEPVEEFELPELPVEVALEPPLEDELPDDGVPDDELPDDEVPDDELPDVEVPDDEVPDVVLVELESEDAEPGAVELAVEEWAACCTKNPRLTADAAATSPPTSLIRDVNRLLFMPKPSPLGFSTPCGLAWHFLWKTPPGDAEHDADLSMTRVVVRSAP